MKIYTRNGDSGQTRLIGGSQISKADQRIEAYGTFDELNSVLGLCQQEAQNQMAKTPALQTLRQQILILQNELFNAGSLLACEKVEDLQKLPKLPESAVTRMEKDIDQMTADLPPLREFILPGGSMLACYLHLARTVCRRAERETVRFLDDNSSGSISLTQAATTEPDYSAIVIYLNRLSDYLFTAARWSNKTLGVNDHTWKKESS